jgi:hypothetical protein
MTMRPPRRIPARFTARALAFIMVTAAGTLLRGQSSYNDNYSGGNFSYSNYDGYSSSGFPRDLNLPPYVPPTPIPVFFPPTPPRLEKVTNLLANTAYRTRPAPALLSAYTNELFYPALAARLDQGELSKSKRAQLERYHDEKRALQQELHNELTAILRLEPSARLPLLAALAARQDARISGLEKREEDFRDDLLKSFYSWNALREWSLSPRAPAKDSTPEVAKVMLAAAYFQSGLSVPQREMLREISIELRTNGKLPAATLAERPWVYFSPALTRVQFPADLPEPAARKLADYLARKAVLRQQLYEAVYREDSAWFSVKRTLALKSLAGRQAAEFAALEALAEDIRRELPAMKAPARYQAPSTLPPALVARIGSIFERNWAERRRIRQEVAKLQERHPTLRIDGYFDQGTLRTKLNYVTASRRAAAGWNEVTAEFQTLKSGYDQLTAGLTRDRDALMPEITAALGRKDAASINTALVEGFMYALDQATGGAMDDYFAATMEPGLSPGQRRLLFDGTVEQLNLPLPEGELQPVARPGERISYNNRRY